MKRKLVTALLAGMSLTMCNVGTAYADTSVEKKDGYVWVTDKESWIEDKVHEEEGYWEDKLIKDAWEETIEHEEEGHMETVVLQPEYVQEVPVSAEIGHSERVTVVDKEAWTEEIQHPEEGHYETVVDKEAWEETIHHEEEGHYENGKLLEKEQGHYEEVVVKPAWEEEKYVVDKEAWTETINHPEEFHYETVVIKPAWEETVEKIKYVCRCGAEFGNVAAWQEHDQHFVEQGDFSHGGYSNVPYHEVIKHPAVTEQKKVVDKEAWTETINHPEEGHTEIIKHPAVTDDIWVVDKPAVYEQIWVVDKEAWDEVIKHPAETHEEWVVDKEAWVEKVEHPAETHEEFQWVVDVPAVTDFIKHPAVTEDKWVVDKEAWTEVVKHEAEYEKVWVVDKEAWTEKIKHDAEGHWELVKTTTKPVTTPEKTEEKGSLQNDNKDADQIPKTGDMTSFSSLIALAGSTLIATGATYKLRKKSKK